TRPTNILGLCAHAKASRHPMPATGMCGAITTKPMQERVSSSAILRNQIGRGTRALGRITGTDSFRTIDASAANELIAKRIIELAKQGECNPDVLCERALKSLREQYL